MKNRLTIIFGLFTICLCNAQTDSLNITQARQRNSFFVDYLNTPITYQKLPVADFTQTTLYTTIKEQDLSEKQTPNKVSYFGFKSNGIFTLKNKLKLFGELNFYRSYAKESAYLLMHNLSKEFSNSIISSPHYSLAIREGDSKNQHYKITGGIAGYVLKKVPFIAKINYNVENYIGFTEPKTEQEINNKAIEFQLGYSMKNHTVYGIAEFLREQDNFSHTFASISDLPTNSIFEPNYYTGFSSGYGDISGYNGSLDDGFIEANTYLYGIGYNFYNENHFFNISYKYKDKKEQYFSSAYKDKTNLAAVLYVDEYHTEAFYILNNKTNKLTVNASYVVAEGRNAQRFLNYASNSEVTNVSSNYYQKISVLDMSANWNKKDKGFTKFGASLSFNFYDELTRDVNTTLKEKLCFKSGIKFNKDFKLTKNTFLNIEGGVSSYNALSNFLDYIDANSSTNVGTVIPPRASFGEDVIIHDYNYDVLSKIGGDFTLNYNFKIKKKTRALVVLSYASLSPTTKDTTFKNSKNNYYNISFNLLY